MLLTQTSRSCASLLCQHQPIWKNVKMLLRLVSQLKQDFFLGKFFFPEKGLNPNGFYNIFALRISVSCTFVGMGLARTCVIERSNPIYISKLCFFFYALLPNGYCQHLISARRAAQALTLTAWLWCETLSFFCFNRFSMTFFIYLVNVGSGNPFQKRFSLSHSICRPNRI